MTAPSTATLPNFSAPDASTASLRDSASASTFPPTHLAPPLAQLPTYHPDSERAPRSQDNALQQQGIPATLRGRAQLQATTSSSTPKGRWNNQVAGGTAAFDNDNGGRKERIEDAGGDVRSPFYTDFDKLAYASNNNSYQNPGNEPRLLDSCALGNSSDRPDIDSNDDTNQHNNSSNSSNTNTTTTTMTTTMTSNINSNDIDSEANVHTFKKKHPQILDNINNTSDCHHSIPVQFSTNDKVTKADEDVECIHRYLLSRCAPPGLSGNVLTCFISRTHCFLIAGGWLWHRQSMADISFMPTPLSDTPSSMTRTTT